MTDIYKIAQLSGLSLRTLKKLDKLGFLKATKASDPIADAIRLNMQKGNGLSALQQFHLLKYPKVRQSLTQWEFEISETLDKLGDALASGAPWQVSSAIELAARKDAAAVTKLVNWLCSFIMCDHGFDNRAKHDHAYLAVRLLANVPDHQIDGLSRKVTAAVWQCRAHPDFQPFWFIEDGKTVYQRPEKKPVAKLDL